MTVTIIIIILLLIITITIYTHLIKTCLIFWLITYVIRKAF